MNDNDETWHWNESLAVPPRSAFYSRFIRFTKWSYLAVLAEPVVVGVVIGVQDFPDFVGMALVYILWAGALMAFFGVLIAPAAGFVLAIVVSVFNALFRRAGKHAPGL